MDLFNTLRQTLHRIRRFWQRTVDRPTIAYDHIRWQQARAEEPSHPTALRQTNDAMRELTWQRYQRTVGATVHLEVLFATIDDLVVLLNGIPKTIALKESINLDVLTPELVHHRLDRFLRTNDGHSIPVTVAFERFSLTLELVLDALYSLSLTDNPHEQYYLRTTLAIREQCVAVQTAFLSVCDQHLDRFN